MSAEISRPHIEGGAVRDGAVRSDGADLRLFATAAGIAWALLFIVLALRFELQTYGDGAIFAYAVAAEDAWAFHWHNIAGRVTAYLAATAPAESYVAFTADARGGIALYGFLFFAAPLAGLCATFVADRSRGRVIFGFACASTAALCPLVFGFPTEMWVAHALFWPTLAAGHYARRTVAGSALVFGLLLALVFTHEGALALAGVIVATLLLRGREDAAFLRAVRAFLLLVTMWAVVHALFPPDYYYADVFMRAALHFFDVTILTRGVVSLAAGALAAYGIAFLLFRRLTPAYAHACGATVVGLGLAVYWLRFDHALLAEDRYYMRTVLLVGTAVFGAVAAAFAVKSEGRLENRVPLLSRVLTVAAAGPVARGIAGAMVLLTLIHAVETAKFVGAFTQYRAAVRALAMGADSDRGLGDPQFVSASRIHADLDPLAWPSTTHFLSVLVAPDFAPARLVVDPRANYFWLSCRTATRNQETDHALPMHSRQLVRLHACLHR